MSAVARALSLYVSEQFTEEDLRWRRATWTTGRFGLRAEETSPRKQS